MHGQFYVLRAAICSGPAQRAICTRVRERTKLNHQGHVDTGLVCYSGPGPRALRPGAIAAGAGCRIMNEFIRAYTEVVQRAASARRGPKPARAERVWIQWPARSFTCLWRAGLG
jgi:hypothetical protein